MDNGSLLLFNTVSLAFAEADPLSQDIMESLDEYLESENPSVAERLHVMKLGGFIVSEEKDETGLLLVRREAARFRSDTLTLTIAPTMNCNMACPYCYQNKNGTEMNDETMDKVIKFVEKYMAQNSVKHLSSHGTEANRCLEKTRLRNYLRALLHYVMRKMSHTTPT